MSFENKVLFSVEIVFVYAIMQCLQHIESLATRRNPYISHPNKGGVTRQFIKYTVSIHPVL